MVVVRRLPRARDVSQRGEHPVGGAGGRSQRAKHHAERERTANHVGDLAFADVALPLDADRLISGELVYAGVVRTPLMALPPTPVGTRAASRR